MTLMHRCVQGHVGGYHQDGGTYVLLSFISCITSLQEILNDITIEQYTVFSIKTSTGKLIDKYGGNQGEILLLPGSQFQVVKIDNNSHVNTIELNDISTEQIQEQDMEIRQRKHKDRNQQTEDVSQNLTNGTGMFYSKLKILYLLTFLSFK